MGKEKTTKGEAGLLAQESRLCSMESRLIAFAPYGLNKLRFIRVSRKEAFLETSHFPSSASNLSCP